MIYTVPEYYNQFQCLASACPATCCAGWQIVIDEKTQEKYRNYKGSFGNRLKNSIDWKDGTFQQYHGRCAFLNEENLCDIHIEAGHDALCRTCRRYPKHVEVYENEREVSLSLSCPAAARLIMGQKQPCRFRSIEKSGEESEKDFDEFLYSALQDCRKVMLELVQDRSVPLQLRMARILALAHDVQNRIERNRVFEVETVLERYQRPQARELLDAKLCRFAEHSKQQQGAEHGWRTGLRCAGECWICFGNLRCSIRFGQRISRCIAGVCMKKAVPLIWIRNCSGQRGQRNGKQSMSRFWSISCLLISVVPSTMEM